MLAAGPVPALREPVGDAHGQAEETQTEAVHLGGDRDVGEDGALAAHQRRAALKVLHHVEDLLALRLPHHAPNVQQRGHVPLPIGSQGNENTGGEKGFVCVCVCL